MSVYERWRRWLAMRLASIMHVDGEKIWDGRDCESGSTPWEVTVTKQLKHGRTLLTICSMLLFITLVTVVWWLPQNLIGLWHFFGGLGAGIILHGAFILVVHEAAHGNLFGRNIDRWISACACGALLLPFVAGRYTRTHIIHHSKANKEGDNNWTLLRDKLYRHSRLLYVIYELIPVVNNVDRLTGQRERCDYAAAVLAWVVAGVLWWQAAIDPWWYLWCLCGLTATNALRLWVEHMGPAASSYRIANTYGGCVFGFGIGNHALHHRYPSVPASILMVGLWLRRHEAHVWTGWWYLFTDRNWGHYSTANKHSALHLNSEVASDVETVA